MRYLSLATVVATASLTASCAPPMTAHDYPKYGFAADFPTPPKVNDTTDPKTDRHTTVFDSQSLGRDFSVMCGRRSLGKRPTMVMQPGRVRSCVRPVCAAFGRWP